MMAPRQGNQSRVPFTMRSAARPLGRLPALAIVMVIFGACSAATASPVASQAASGPTATVPPSQTAQQTARPSASPTASPTVAGPHLTYVALGDSLLFALEDDCNSCTSAVVIYGKQIETDLGMPVEVHNLTMHNGLKTPGLLEYLKDGVRIGRTAENARTAVAAADIVSITIGFNDSTLSDKDNLTAFVDEYAATLDAILGEVDALRAGKPTMVRVTTIYNNGIAEKPELDPDGPGSGVNGWKPIVEAQNAAICEVAAKHKAACVDLYEPYNGKDGLASPLTKGYIAPDGVHPSQLGMDVIAAALVGAGYAPLR